MFKLLLIIFLYASSSFSSLIIIDENTNALDILQNSEIFIDNTKKLTLEDIKTKNFEKNDKTTLSYGYAPPFSVWVKFTLKNSTNKPIKKILQYDHEITSYIQFFDEDKVYNEGINNLPKGRVSVKPIFPIDLEANEVKTYYILTKSYITPLTVKLNIWDSEHFYEKEINHQIALALFFGAMIILGLYNLFIYFSTRDKSYLFYVFYIFGAVLHHIFYSGLIYKFNMTSVVEFLGTRGAYIIVTTQFIALLLFSKHFLELKNYPKLNNIINFYIISVPVLVIFSTIFEYTAGIQNLFYISSLIYLFAIAIYLSTKGKRPAYFILIGWLVLFTTWILMYIINIGIITHEFYSYYLVEIGILGEALIFSFALADRIKILQKEREKANELLISQQKSEKQRLEIEVNNKTKDLKQALDEKDLLFKELHHRVKNNMQMIVSMIRLQSRNIEDSKLQEVFQTAQNRINTMAHLHELLYKQDNITHINTYEYFVLLIDELQKSSNKKVEIIYNIKANLKMEQAIYCGLILNELVSNSFKYAFTNKKDGEGIIEINLLKQNDTYILEVKDNGSGYDSSKKTDSLGLVLINTLATRQLKGTIEIDSTKQTKVLINWTSKDE